MPPHSSGKRYLKVVPHHNPGVVPHRISSGPERRLEGNARDPLQNQNLAWESARKFLISILEGEIGTGRGLHGFVGFEGDFVAHIREFTYLGNRPSVQRI